MFSKDRIADVLFNQSIPPVLLTNQVINLEKNLTVPYAPANLTAYLTANTHLLALIYVKALPPSLPKALVSLPSSPTKSITSLLSRSPKRRHRDTIDSIRSSVFDSPSPATNSQSSSDTTSQTTTSSFDDGVVIGKRSSLLFLRQDKTERGVVVGVRSFVEGIRGKDWSSNIFENDC
jgi:hypothetical protein